MRSAKTTNIVARKLTQETNRIFIQVDLSPLTVTHQIKIIKKAIIELTMLTQNVLDSYWYQK